MNRFKCKTVVNLLLVALLLSVGLPINSFSESRSIAPKSLVLLNVVKAWGTPEQMNWEYHAPIKATPSYQLYEATIWSDHVSLYRFDESFGSGELTPAYREQYLVSEFPIEGVVGSESASKSIAKAFQSFFAIMLKETPSHYYGLKYTGHGSGAGSLFANAIQKEDAQQLLKSMTKQLGRKLDFYDMGTNCNQGTVGMMNALYPYFDYVIASELAVGGYKMDEDKKERFGDIYEFNLYPSIFAANDPLETKLINVVKLARKSWVYSKKNMTTAKYKQSVSLLKMENYPALINGLRVTLKSKNIDPSTFNYSLKQMVQKTKKKELMDQYNRLVVRRENNGDFFKWDFNQGALVFDRPEDILYFDAVYR